MSVIAKHRQRYHLFFFFVCLFTDAQVGCVDNDRPFYVRVRLPDPAAGANQPPPGPRSPPCYHWSDCFVISTADHARRSFFNSRQPEVCMW